MGRFKSAIFDQYLAISQKRCKIGTYYYGTLTGTRLCFIDISSDPNFLKLPIFDILFRLSYLHSEWSLRLRI